MTAKTAIASIASVGVLVSSFAISAKAQTDTAWSLQHWLEQPTMTGDWGGLRTELMNRGINLQALYTGEAVRNTAGLHGVATDYAQTIGFGADVDLGRLGVDPNGTFRVWLTDRTGRNLGADKLGSLFQTQETFGQGQDFRLNEVSLAQAFADGLLNLKGGFYPMGKDFGSLPAFCNFVSNAFCGHPLVMPFDSGWDDDPSGRWGGRIRVSPTQTFYVQTGVFQVNPTYPKEGNGFKLNFQGDTGVIIPLEVMYQPSTDPRFVGIYKVGAYYDTSTVSDVFTPTKRDTGRQGAYVLGQQKVYSETANPNRGITIAGFYAVGDENTGTMKRTYHFGLSYKGTFSGRDLDTVNIGWVAAEINPRLIAHERLTGAPTQSTENLLEMNYGAVLTPWLQLKPGVQYDSDPGAYTARPNAWVFELQMKVTL
jgi:porin